MSETILTIEHLSVSFRQGNRLVRAVSDVSFELKNATRAGLIGESGSGKSVTALSVLRLHDPRHVQFGERSRILYRGDDILQMGSRRLRRVRGRRIGMIFQNPMTSMNPVFTIGDQIERVLKLHHGVGTPEARRRAVEALAEVELPDPEGQLRRYPNELSGGQRQRALIAMVLACEPEIIIADEPTSALDVTVQASILDMLRSRADERGISVLMITHDMGVVARFCTELSVMYGGMVAETGPVGDLFGAPTHPYTSGLLRSIPNLAAERGSRLYSIPGRQHQRLDEVSSCPFTARCDHAIAACSDGRPELVPVGPAHSVSCIRHDELDLGGTG